MFAVEVQDAQGRYVPIADNPGEFPGLRRRAKVIGVGNGDPTSHESDKGSVAEGLQRALHGAGAVHQESAGRLPWRRRSPGLTPSILTLTSKAVKLRPQVAVWEREVPSGEGITGLWRSAPVAAATGGFGGAGASQVFTFRQSGSTLTGTVEGGGGRGAPAGPAAIEDGKVDGGNVSFTAAGAHYTGTLKGGGIELTRSGGNFGRGGRRAAVEPTGPRPAIGPPPDGSDPSNAAFVGLGRGGRGMQTPAPVVLHRASR